MKEHPAKAKTEGRSLLARLGLAVLYFLGGCGVSAAALILFVAAAATGAFRGSNGSPEMKVVFFLLFTPAGLGIVAAIVVIVTGKGIGLRPPSG